MGPGVNAAAAVAQANVHTHARAGPGLSVKPRDHESEYHTLLYTSTTLDRGGGDSITDGEEASGAAVRACFLGTM